MKAASLGNPPDNRFSLSGVCPHCSRDSVFMPVTSVHLKSNLTHANLQQMVAGMQCQGCMEFILGMINRDANTGRWEYLEHYPIGKPDDKVAEEIPENIAADFKEALRCRFVDAYNATVEMCRRAVQTSCIDLNAPPSDKLEKQIDWLFQKGVITAPLKDMAHRVRLGGNLGAHPPKDADDEDVIIIGPEYANAVVEFTRDFFQHVYVMPERLKKYTFSKKPGT